MYTKKILNGYYYQDVTYDKRLEFMPYASAGVLIDNNGNGGVALISYTTPVIIINGEGWMQCYGTFSRTTIKHISAFMKEYGNGMGYYEAKHAYEGGYLINIYTAEIKPINK